ncbi:protein-tyrosine phosphatase family protein [Dyella humicola]|uniref:phosphatase domain-containing protein n=1 Tax=Dyella humicola TaxID=2992126 RepID=UPI00225716EF|nr:protein-tyrosine phosphatase family protein [Dyella humicola]
MPNTTIRTSVTDPLRIATLPVTGGGAIGVTFAPGKHQVNAMSGGTWQRDLDVDLQAIKRWGADVLITLLEQEELTELAIAPLASRAEAAGLRWFGLPITDGAAPDDRFLVPWSELGPRFARELQNGGRLVVHCKGGLGRAGTVACLLLHATGAARGADEAMAMVRAVRRGAIETKAQESFLHAWYSQG